METRADPLTVLRMHDDFQPGLDAVDQLDGATPLLFSHFYIAGDAEGEPRRDVIALAATLAGRAQAVTVRDHADLIVTGSAPDGTPGRVTLERSALEVLEGSRAAVAVAPRGLAERGDYEVRRIDVGIDGSREAAAALAIAVRLALVHSARLRLTAVAQIDFGLSGKARGADPRELERLARHLEHAAEGIAGIGVEAELREGLTDQIIIGLAREADLLVLGSRASYGGAGQVALGDVGRRILHGAPCPTLVVPAP
jgi:nucleotide-binding universal stress UspA family protein